MEIINKWFNIAQYATAKAETLPNSLHCDSSLDLETNFATENRKFATFTVLVEKINNEPFDIESGVTHALIPHSATTK